MARPKGITLFPEDWTRICLALPPLACGALFRLAFPSLSEPEPCCLPDSDQILAYRAGLTVAEWAEVRTALAPFMDGDGKSVRFPWLRRRYDEAAAYRRVQSENGRQGGRPPKPKETDALATLKPTQNSTSPFPFESTSKKKTSGPPDAVDGAKPPPPAAGDGLWGATRHGIRLDPIKAEWVGVTDYDREAWRTAYPACSVETAIRQAALWCVANPAKGRKSNYRAFLVRWLQRQQDSGGTRVTAPHSPASNGVVHVPPMKRQGTF